jgi:hypothetical protein
MFMSTGIVHLKYHIEKALSVKTVAPHGFVEGL